MDQIESHEKRAREEMARLKAKGKRFVIIDGSESAHCCFTHTIVDTQSETPRSENRAALWFDSVCECFDEESAKLIVKALNKHT